MELCRSCPKIVAKLFKMEPQLSQNGAQIDPGGSRGAPGTPSDVLGAPGRSPRRSGIDFGAILDKFWFHFGTVFASKMQLFQGCCWCCFWMRFGMDFGDILGQFWHDFWSHFNDFAELPE